MSVRSYFLFFMQKTAYDMSAQLEICRLRWLLFGYSVFSQKLPHFRLGDRNIEVSYSEMPESVHDRVDDSCGRSGATDFRSHYSENMMSERNTYFRPLVTATPSWYNVCLNTRIIPDSGLTLMPF